MQAVMVGGETESGTSASEDNSDEEIPAKLEGDRDPDVEEAEALVGGEDVENEEGEK